MRYKAYFYTAGRDSGGHPTTTLSTSFVRCGMKAKSSIETDDEAGVYSTTTYELRFWHRDAENHRIRAGKELVVDDIPLRIVGAKPAGMGLKQWTICTAEVATDS